MKARHALLIRKGIWLARHNHPRFDWRNSVSQEPWLVIHAWRRTAERMDRGKR